MAQSLDVSLTIPFAPLAVVQVLRAAGFEAYLVGGAVRDLLMKVKGFDSAPSFVTDYDIATNATPDQTSQLFPESYYENKFGTVSIPHAALLEQLHLDPERYPRPLTDKSPPTHRLMDIATATKIHTSLVAPTKAENRASADWPDYEITTYRSQELYSNFRHPDPDTLTWGTSITEDLQRRDFTINAITLNLEDEVLLTKLDTAKEKDDFWITLAPKEFELIDPFDGVVDLEHGLIRTVGQPQTRFREDALRMLRAIRFSVQLNLKIESETFLAIRHHASLIAEISWERISDELLKMLKSDFPAEAIKLLDEVGLLDYILPELLEAKGVEQAGHHTTDVWTHSLDALAECPSPDPIVRLATLLHDIAKPRTYRRQNNTITFYNHEVVGARMAKEIGQRLKLSKQDIERLFILVRYHMFYYQPHNTDAAIRRFMRRVQLENIDDILDLREADRLGSGARKTSWRLEEMKQRMVEQLHQPLDVTDLALNGRDLMTELGLKPGPVLGKLLHQLFELVLEDPDRNDRSILLEEARKMLTS